MPWENILCNVEILSDMEIPYKRPFVFSDPNRDFSKEELEKIILTKDSELGVYELQCIFQRYLPAGHYDECAYFAPIAIDRIQSGCEEAASLLYNFIFWCQDNVIHLEEDDVLTDILGCLCDCFKVWTKEFALVKKEDGGISAKYSGEIEVLISAMNESKKLIDADWLINEHLLPLHTYDQAAWLFMLLRNPTMNSTLLMSLKNDSLFNGKVNELILERVCKSSDPLVSAYWEDRKSVV